MQITDTPNNTRFTYLYIHDFEWLDNADRETNVGHPKIGEVYRAVVNKDTGTYRLFYEVDNVLNGMYLAKLQVTEVDEVEYESNITEVTKSNIISLHLTEQQLDTLSQWMNEDNAPVRQMMNLPPTVPLPPPTPQAVNLTADQVIDHIENQRQHQEFVKLGSYLGELSQTDPPMYAALSEFIYSLDDSGAESPIDTNWTTFSSVLGSGKNISGAIECLARYGGDNRRTNLDSKDLLAAMNHLLNELIRRQFHEH